MQMKVEPVVTIRVIQKMKSKVMILMVTNSDPFMDWQGNDKSGVSSLLKKSYFTPKHSLNYLKSSMKMDTTCIPT